MYVCQWHLDMPFGKQGDAGGVGSGLFKEHAQALAPLIIPATQRRDVYKVIGQ